MWVNHLIIIIILFISLQRNFKQFTFLRFQIPGISFLSSEEADDRVFIGQNRTPLFNPSLYFYQVIRAGSWLGNVPLNQSADKIVVLLPLNRCSAENHKLVADIMTAKEFYSSRFTILKSFSLEFHIPDRDSSDSPGYLSLGDDDDTGVNGTAATTRLIWRWNAGMRFFCVSSSTEVSKVIGPGLECEHRIPPPPLNQKSIFDESGENSRALSRPLTHYHFIELIHNNSESSNINRSPSPRWTITS